jgi:hypothetical protein
MEVQVSKRLIAMIVAALAVLALVAGCGGGSDSDSGDSSAATTEAADGGGSGAPALSKAEFIKQGDVICTKVAGELAKGIADFMSENGLGQTEEPSEEQQEELVAEVILPLFKSQAEQIGELGAPEGEEEAVAEIVEGTEEAVAEGEEDLSGAIGGDNPLQGVNEKAQDFGFQICGKEA